MRKLLVRYLSFVHRITIDKTILFLQIDLDHLGSLIPHSQKKVNAKREDWALIRLVLQGKVEAISKSEKKKFKRIHRKFYLDSDTLKLRRTNAMVVERPDEIKKIIELEHQKGHFRREAMEYQLRENYYFHGMRTAIETIVSLILLNLI